MTYKPTINEVLAHYVDDAEYIVYYNNVIILLDMLEIEYDIKEINKMSYNEIEEASIDLTKVYDLIRYTLGR